MKITTEHVETLAAAIKPHDTNEWRQVYRDGKFPRADAVKDLNKRYRWDLFWAAWHASPTVRELLGEYNDAHIDTALRAIVPSLEQTVEDDALVDPCHVCGGTAYYVVNNRPCCSSHTA